jgi:hypothetical protein
VLELATTSPHLSHSEIGRLLGLSHQSVMRLRQAATTDVRSLTQTVMQTDIAPALEEWTAARTAAALKGDHRPSRDWLVAAGAIEDSAKGAQLAVGFQVVIAPSPGTPAYAAVNEPPAAVVTRVSAPAAYLAGASVGQTPSETAHTAPDATAHHAHPPTEQPLSTPTPQCAPVSAQGVPRTTRSRVRR